METPDPNERFRERRLKARSRKRIQRTTGAIGGQSPQRLARFVDAIYPMTYPSHYGPGEYGLADPSATPSRTVGRSLRDFRRQMRGKKAKLIPWLEDFTLGGTTTMQKVREQIRAARRWKTGGFLRWNPSGVYTLGALTAS
jgi:hypothetical protein